MPPKITPVTEEEILDAVGKEDDKTKILAPPDKKENVIQTAENATSKKTSNGKEKPSSKKDNTKIDVNGSSSNNGDEEPLKKESYASISKDDLEMLVPIFLEDAADGNCSSIKQILDLDSKTDQYSIIKQRDDEGRSALHKAALEGRMDALRLLINYITEKSPELLDELINSTDQYGNTPFFQVCVKLHKSDHSMAEFLTNHGAKVDIVKTTTQMTPLHWAGYHGNSDLGAVILNLWKEKSA